MQHPTLEPLGPVPALTRDHPTADEMRHSDRFWNVSENSRRIHDAPRLVGTQSLHLKKHVLRLVPSPARRSMATRRP